MPVRIIASGIMKKAIIKTRATKLSLTRKQLSQFARYFHKITID